MVDEGYAATQILSQLHESIIEKELGDKQKSAVTEKMAVRSCSCFRRVWLLGDWPGPQLGFVCSGSGCEQVSVRRRRRVPPDVESVLGHHAAELAELKSERRGGGAFRRPSVVHHAGDERMGRACSHMHFIKMGQIW